MPTSANLRKRETRIAALPEQVVREALKTIQEPARNRLRIDTGGDFRLSGLKGAGPRMSVTVKVRGGSLVEGVVQAGPKRLLGPMSWLESGTKARRQGRGRHPGTPAKRTWSSPTGAAQSKAIADVRRRFSAVIR